MEYTDLVIFKVQIYSQITNTMINKPIINKI
jgi:hypothetical protein